MKRFGKYEFDSKEQAEQVLEQAFSQIKGMPINQDVVIDEDGNEQLEITETTIYDLKHSIVHLGNIPLTFDEETNEVLAYSEKWSVDVLFVFSQGELAEEPEALEDYAIEIESEGIHGFLGLKYQSLKFNKDVEEAE